MPDCPICCESYNNSVRTAISCNNSLCDYTACKTCIRQYLLGTTSDPHCMSCKNGWDQRFVIEQLNKSYYNTTYKKHRVELLTERQISMMPATMEQANRRIQTRLLDDELKSIDLKRKELRNQINQLEHEKYNIQRSIRNF